LFDLLYELVPTWQQQVLKVLVCCLVFMLNRTRSWLTSLEKYVLHLQYIIQLIV